jgi:S1-C subfamily serine protease
VDEVNRVVPRLIRYQKAVRPTLGISLAPDQLARTRGIQGVLVIDTVPAGPAAAAGLRSTTRDEEGNIRLGDIIVGVTVEGEKHAVASSEDLYTALEAASVGQTVTLSVRRGAELGPAGTIDGGQVENVPVTLGAGTRQK